MENGRIGERLGVWRLDELIGSGGMGDVYLAHRTKLIRQRAAVKVLRSIHEDNSADEADTLRPLCHPHIARYLGDGWTNDGHRYLAVEFVEGNPITDYADQKGLSIHERLRLFVQACEAVEYAHKRGVIHLDLKPGNILVNKDAAIKIIDFGVARRLDRRGLVGSSRAFSGAYASPEQIQTDLATLKTAPQTQAQLTPR